MLCLSTLLTILGLLITAASSADEPGLIERRYRGLKFGATNQDYVLFKPRMEPLQESYSLCGWVKKILSTSSTSKYWFAYGTSSNVDEIRSEVNGYFYTFSTHIDMRSKVTDQLGTWRHVCLTWSFTTRTASVYYDGLLLGSATTPSGRKVGLDGYVVLGNEFQKYGGDFNWPFGGELFKVNMFDKELDAAEVKEMADGGLCSEVEEKYGRSRYLKWEDLLLEEKSGNVTEIDVGCTPEEKKEYGEGETNSTEDCECEQVNGTTVSRWDLLRGEKFFNKTVSVELVEQLKQTWDILGKLLHVSVDLCL